MYTCVGLGPSAMKMSDGTEELLSSCSLPGLLSLPFAPKTEAGCGCTAQDISSAKDCSFLLLLTSKAQALQGDLVASG